MNLTKEKILELLKPIQIVKVLEVNPHPNADRLVLVQVEMRPPSPALPQGREIKQVVTGATNMKVGDLVPYLGEGNIIPGFLFSKGEEIKLEKRMLRGIESDSMILAEDEIGLSDDHGGIAIVMREDGTTNYELRDMNYEELLGSSLVEVFTDKLIDIICKKAGIVDITPDLQERIDLIKSVAADGGEIVGEDELPALLASGEKLFTYDGFEPSGQMHIAQGVVRAINVNKMIKAGFTFRMWVADWFGYLNNKMGGDLDKIKRVGEYFIEIWKASGMDLEGTEFLWTSDHVGDRAYWELVMKVARSSTLKRVLRTTEIMGRSETDNLSAAQILYPCMQITDIFQVMKAQVTELGMDQRKVNMLAREIGQELGYWKPIVVSHGMLQGLQKPLPKGADPVERAISMKMSKSKPETAIFMTDTVEDVADKIRKAYCPEGEVEDNPILAYCKQVIFEAHHLKRETPLLENGQFVVERDEKFGGTVAYKSYEELATDYSAKNLFPLDLKNAVVKYVNALLQPVRDHFENDANAKAILADVKSFQVTR